MAIEASEAVVVVAVSLSLLASTEVAKRLSPPQTLSKLKPFNGRPAKLKAKATSRIDVLITLQRLLHRISPKSCSNSFLNWFVHMAIRRKNKKLIMLCFNT